MQKSKLTGICIHGVQGAQMKKGCLRSPDCLRCEQDTQLEDTLSQLEDTLSQLLPDFESREDMFENQHRV